MTAISIWANALDVPELVCDDARLHGARGRQLAYQDRPSGQAGWHVGMRFGSLASLAQQLDRLLLPEYVTTPRLYDSRRPVRSLRRGEVFRLALNAHGVPGTVFLSGQRSSAGALRVGEVARYGGELRDIHRLLQPGSFVYFMGCNVAAGAGRQLLNELSGSYWQKPFVVGFTGRGYAHAGGMTRQGEMCTEPGMRDTGHNAVRSGQLSDGSHPNWTKLAHLPWASERSPGAVVSCGGRIIHCPEEPHPERLPL